MNVGNVSLLRKSGDSHVFRKKRAKKDGSPRFSWLAIRESVAFPIRALTARLHIRKLRGNLPGDKAPDALFRQGEALLELGPSYHGAAIKAFERLIAEYPDSALVEQARRQLQAAKAG